MLDNTIVDAITFTDPLLLGDPHTHMLFMADVSFHFVSSSSGYTKTSIMSAVNFSHHVNVCCTTMITHENQVTFEFELETYIGDHDSSLPLRETVWIVDGDRGRIGAANCFLLPKFTFAFGTRVKT